MKGLDLRKFKKVSTDGNTTTFKHEDGHIIKIAHSKLSKEMRKTLEKLPHYDEGGYVEPTQAQMDAEMQKYEAKPLTHDQMTDQYNKGTPGTHSPPYTGPNYGDVQAGDFQGTDQPFDSAGFRNQAAAEEAPVAPTPVPMQGPGPAIAKAPPAGDMISDYAKAYMGGVGEQKQGITGTANVESQNEAEVANKLKSLSQFESGQAGGFRDILQDAQNKAFAQREAFRQDVINNHIDPNKIFQNATTGQKVAAGLGLLVSGMGSGLAHQQNLAYDFLTKQRDLDLAAQEKNLDSYQGIYYHNFQDLGDRMSALNMSKININDAYTHQLQAIAATTKSQNAKNAALGAIGQLDKESAFLQSQIINNQSQGAANPDKMANTIRALEFINPEMAKNLKEKYVPSVGVAAIPVPEKDRNEITTRQDLNNKISQLRDFAQQNQGSLNPATINEGNAKAKLVQDAYRQAAGAGVFKESEKNFLNSIVSDNPTAFFNKFRTDPGYKAMENSNLQSLNTLYQNYGLKQQNPNWGAGQIKTFRPKQ